MMISVLLAARLLLAGVFLVSGIAKLADRRGSQKAIIDFGLPAALAPTLGLLLPFAELTIAVALVPRLTAWWGALGALVLLVLFVIGISYNLAHGRTPDCHCFGQLHSAPIGWPTLARNGVLVVLSSFVLWFGRPDPGLSAVSWVGALTPVERVGAFLAAIVFALLAGESWLLYHVLRRYGSLLLRVEALETNRTDTGDAIRAGEVGQAGPTPTAGPSVGTIAPPFRLSGLTGGTFTLDTLLAAGKPVVLLFVDPGCGPCTALLPEVARWQHEYAGKLTLALISRGTPEANRLKTAEHKISHVLLQRDREVAQAYQAHGTPSAVLVRSDGMIGSPLSQGADAIRALVAGSIGLPMLKTLPAAAVNGNGLRGGNGQATVQPSAELKVGEPVSAFTLPDLTGKSVSLADFRGKHTLVLFWNPGCGFCQRMLEDIKAWEANPPEGAPRLLVVSTGTVEANQAMGLRSPVLLDQNLTVGRTLGASGTPTAVLIDAEGDVASAPAVGAPAVLALAGQVPAKPTPV
jgi:peroxiredoxin/uncharacterized membrane protein YphA (DoxX/SURF4 family)